MFIERITCLLLVKDNWQGYRRNSWKLLADGGPAGVQEDMRWALHEPHPRNGTRLGGRRSRDSSVPLVPTENRGEERYPIASSGGLTSPFHVNNRINGCSGHVWVVPMQASIMYFCFVPLFAWDFISRFVQLSIPIFSPISHIFSV